MVKFKFLARLPVNHIIIIVIYSFRVFHISVSWWFFTSVLADGFSLEFEWQQVSSSLQDSSQDSGCSQQYCRLDSLYPSANFKSSRPFNNPLVIVPNTPITIGTIVTFMFHSFFSSLARSRYLSFFSLSFKFILQFCRFSFFCLLAGIRWSVCMLKSHRSLCESYYQIGRVT